MRWRLHLEYDGAPFAGWQLQPGVDTVQGVVESALEPLLGHFVRVHCAGRTDAGVHAAMQIATFDTEAIRTAKDIRDGLNFRLPRAIACVSAEPIGDDFDPRHTPHTKTYRYTWLVRPSRSPLREGRAWHVRHPLDGPAMAAAVARIVGTHDFASMRAVKCNATHTIRTVVAASVETFGEEIRLSIRGTGFLRHMVRILAGTLYEIGRGAQEPTWILAVLAARDRRAAGRTAPAEGLVLEDIAYHADGALDGFEPSDEDIEPPE